MDATITPLAYLALALAAIAFVLAVLSYRRGETDADWFVGFGLLLVSVAVGAAAVLLRQSQPAASTGLVVGQFLVLPVSLWKLWAHFRRHRTTAAKKPRR